MSTTLQPPLIDNDPNWKPDLPLVRTPNDLLAIALNNNAAIDVIERLAALQEKALARDAEIEFNQAMNAVQTELGRISADATNPETHSRYATYAKLDKVIRPIYTKHGFSLSFDTADAPQPEMVRAVCYVSHRAGHTRRYQADVPADGKGPKGGAVMTKTHASGAAMQYGQRYLLKYIFNVAISEDDTDGNLAQPVKGMMNPKERQERYEYFDKIGSFEALEEHWRNSRKAAIDAKDDDAKNAFDAAKNRRKGELRQAGAK